LVVRHCAAGQERRYRSATTGKITSVEVETTIVQKKEAAEKRSKNGSHVKTSTEAVAENTLYNACSDLRFQPHKRSQHFIRVRNETLSVIAVCVSDRGRADILTFSEVLGIDFS